MPKCDFNKVANTHAEVHECSPVNLPHIFRTSFLRNTSGWLLVITIFFVKDFIFSKFGDRIHGIRLLEVLCNESHYGECLRHLTKEATRGVL